ncbi:5333_t:CDS:2 [Funneliformis mosseae]|uniref:5333_t:CDS:1 n=1 Tax=Funneliformis mosseae TaxID=27381 RepID=A0A9N8WF44_FUNMO|nr:5333_t:CDS:2 [Funneliformis mosseae]
MALYAAIFLQQFFYGSGYNTFKYTAISVISGDKFGTIEYIVELNLSHLESICRCHVYTKEQLKQEIESEITQTVQGNNITEFAYTINNPINIRTKGQKPKNSSNIYANCKADYELNVDVGAEGSRSKSR